VLVPAAPVAPLGDWQLPSFAEIFACKQPTLKYVPNSQRQIFGSTLCTALTAVLAENSVDAWKKLLMLSKCVLPCVASKAQREGCLSAGRSL